MGGFRTFTFSTFHLFDPGYEVVNGFGGDYLLLCKGLPEELDELLISQILLETPCSQYRAHLRGFEDATHALFVTVHERDHGGKDASNVPTGTPSLLVVVREGSADGLADLEATVVGQKSNFGW